MTTVLGVVYAVLFVFMLLLWARLVLSWVVMFAPRWSPAGVTVVGVEGVFTLTDPPIRLIRRVVPSPQIGPIRLDLGFLLVMVITYLLMQVVVRAM